MTVSPDDASPARRNGAVAAASRPRADGDAAAYDADIAPVAALLADRARAAMLMALLDGLPRAAGELSKLAGVSPATASAHLARLLNGGVLAVDQQGRHRYYRLAGPEIATVLEVLAQISPVKLALGLRQSREAAALADARTCYDHLAGRAGVALLDALLEAGILLRQDGAARGGYQVTDAGARTLAGFGVDVAGLRRSRRLFAGSCLDWTQRRPHLSGALGAAITARLLELGWIEYGRSRRSVRITGAGQDGLAKTFGWAAGQ